MNIETGQIMQLTDEQKALLEKMGQNVLSIDESLRTERERVTGQVYLGETATAESPLAKQLRAARSAYLPHVGAKQAAKAAARTLDQIG